MIIKKVLVANRGEIAIRIFRACVELGIRTCAIYTYEDRYSQHRYKADEAYQVGNDNEPLKPYLDMDEIIHIAKENNADAIHPGYGFLSENSNFARKCQEAGIIFIGPRPEVMEALGDKIKAKQIAIANDVPVIESNKDDIADFNIALREAHRIGYPIMIKASAGGGGRGMRVVRNDDELTVCYGEARREAKTAFGDDTVFMEKFVENPKHIEVQIAADNFGNIIHLFERDCSVQRRFQKVVEIAPAISLNEEVRNKLYAYALCLAKAVNYNNVGTVEFLVGQDSKIYFIEVNTRIQVEHTVTEMITSIDLVKLQIRAAAGFKLFEDQIGIQSQSEVSKYGCAIQCRITTEDPLNDFKPDYGTIIAYRSPGGLGIRLDQGSIYTGVKISPFFDSMLVKVAAHSRTFEGAVRKMKRALEEFRVRGVKHNIEFLHNIMNHPEFISGNTKVNFIKDHPELFQFSKRKDRATRVVKYLGDVTINGHPDIKIIDKEIHKRFVKPFVPPFKHHEAFPKGSKDLLTEIGVDEFCRRLRNDKRIHYTDTTLRDAHQSLLATRVRTYDMLKVAESFAKHHPQTFSMEVWGGATFDVCLRFLHEDPWERLSELRKAVPNILLQMLIRGANGVGYSAYPDNLIEKFVEKSWETGIDVFRIFDSLNWMKGIEPCIRFVRNQTGGIAEASLCYTGDILDKSKNKYDLKYYLQLAKDMENAGAHVLGIKDMAGLLKPYAAKVLIEALNDTVKIPIHLHTHDTSSLQSATYLMAIEAGVNIIDVALGGLSGLTSQPNFNAIVEMMRFHRRENPYDIKSLNQFSSYWETVREYYYPFESGLKASTAEVFHHEIPGGQYSNLKPQAFALGLGDKFEQIKETYEEVNRLFGDVVKVTPSSKVVGDMAQFMVSNGLTANDVLEKGENISFPESVQSYFQGQIGQPYGGFPEKLQKIILKDKQALNGRPNDHLELIDFEKDFAGFQEKFDSSLKFTDYLSYKFYPKVFEEYYKFLQEYGNVMRIPTKNFFFGMDLREEAMVEIEKGKSLVIKLLTKGSADENGKCTMFFEINGQIRNIEVLDKSQKIEKKENKKIEKDNPKQIGAPLQGLLSKIFVKKGQPVKKNEPLFVIEAMKMETTITASDSAEVKDIALKEGTRVGADDLVLVLA
jgi:pyruvate carboxylase